HHAVGRVVVVVILRAGLVRRVAQQQQAVGAVGVGDGAPVRARHRLGQEAVDVVGELRDARRPVGIHVSGGLDLDAGLLGGVPVGVGVAGGGRGRGAAVGGRGVHASECAEAGLRRGVGVVGLVDEVVVLRHRLVELVGDAAHAPVRVVLGD